MFEENRQDWSEIFAVVSLLEGNSGRTFRLEGSDILVKRHVAEFIAHRSLVRELLASNVPFEKRFCR